jgi:molybdate transport system substrate-binding protein
MKTLGFALLILLSGSESLCAQDLKIAAASDLGFVIKDLGANFEKQTGTKVSVTLGSSGNFFTQIQQGAPFDLFMSADIVYPQKLEQAGLGEPGTLYQYATGKIVLWVPGNSPLDVNQGWALLTDPRVRKLAIANPKHAPYGRAAVAAMTKAGIYERITDKLVFGENISQTAQFVDSGNADAGIIALSLAMAPVMKDKGRYWEVPQDLYPPLDQGAIVVKASPNKALAKQFLDFMRTSESVALLQRYGFKLPDAVVRAAGKGAGPESKKTKK